jgi:hypothetical protein
MGWATFWAMFSKTRLVTLFSNNFEVFKVDRLTARVRSACFLRYWSDSRHKFE